MSWFDQSGVLADGSEQFVSTVTVGRDKPNFSGKSFDGEVMISAGQTQQAVKADLSQIVASYQGRSPIPCESGQSARFTTLHASSVTTTRWPGKFGSDGPYLAQVKVPLDAALAVS